MEGAVNAATVAEMAEALRGEADRLAREMGVRAAQRAPEWVTERPEFAQRAFLVSRAGFEAGLVALAGGGRIPRECPPPDREFATIAAQQGVPPARVLDAYRQAHAVVWEAWMQLAARREPDSVARQALLEAGSRFFFAYFDRVTDLVLEALAQEREARLRTGRRLLHLVREVLDGRDADLSPEGYDLAWHHLGVVVWGRTRHEAAQAVAAALERRLLIVDVFEETSWAWLGGPDALGPRAGRLSAFAPPAEARLAVGVEAAGRDGFRQTHADARDAQRAAWPAARPVTAFDDVVLEALAARDEAAARRFVARELRGLEGDDARSRRLRETLEAYFAHGGNAAATAKALGLHEQTVAQRLTAVEQRTRRAVVRRRAELEVALRLRRYLAPPARTAEGPARAGPSGPTSSGSSY